MAAHDYKSLRPHVGHSIVCVVYGRPESPPGRQLDTGPLPGDSVALECEECAEVLLSYDHEPGNEPPARRVKRRSKREKKEK